MFQLRSIAYEVLRKKDFILPQIHNSATALKVALKLLITLSAETSSVKIFVGKNVHRQKLLSPCDNLRSNVSQKLPGESFWPVNILVT